MEQDFIKFSEVKKVEEIKRETENIKAYATKLIAIINGKAQKEATEILETAKGELAAQNIEAVER